MGNKRITEKDFWMCTNGAVPAQLQGTNTTTKKQSGDKYITIQDKATSSWIDFGCTKLMLIYALLAAAVVVIAAMTVATGGAALIALGALAGLAGAAWGAVVGSMLCGHQGAKIREWIKVPKAKQTLIQGVEQVTGDYKMSCMIPGGMVTFAPQIKNWSQAISLGASNYLGKLMEGMMAGAAVGMGGALLSGGAGAFASGGMRGVGQAAWQFAKTMPKNFVVNAIESVSKFGLALRGVMGIQNTAATYGNTGEASATDFLKGTVAMETGAYDSFQNIKNGKGTWQDWVGMAMMFAPVGQGKRDLEDGINKKVDDAEGKKADDEGTKVKSQEPDNTSKQKEDGEAYEADPVRVNQELIDAVEAKAKELIEKAKNKEDGYSNKKNGPCLSGVYDTVTGETHFGQNFEKNITGKKEYNQFVEDAHPIVKERIKQQQKLIDEGKLDPKLDKRAGGHSEVRALDAAIKAREKATGKPVTEADLGSFDLHNRQMPNNNPMHRCGNCSHITNGVNTVGGHN